MQDLEGWFSPQGEASRLISDDRVVEGLPDIAI